MSVFYWHQKYCSKQYSNVVKKVFQYSSRKEKNTVYIYMIYCISYNIKIQGSPVLTIRLLYHSSSDNIFRTILGSCVRAITSASTVGQVLFLFICGETAAVSLETTKA